MAATIGSNYLSRTLSHDQLVIDSCTKYGSRFLNSITSFIDFLLKMDRLNPKLVANLKFLGSHFKINKDITTIIDTVKGIVASFICMIKHYATLTNAEKGLSDFSWIERDMKLFDSEQDFSGEFQPEELNIKPFLCRMSKPFKIDFKNVSDTYEPCPVRFAIPYGGFFLYLSTRTDRRHKILPISVIMDCIKECTTKEVAGPPKHTEIDEDITIGIEGKSIVGGINIQSIVLLFIVDIFVGAMHIVGMIDECKWNSS